ncbi:MAG: hypothetical protein ACRC3H_15995 [Lachnospiraceae bacterium]
MAKKKKPHGHYCKVCGEHKANEKFSGKGHAAHICKSCMKLSPAQRSKEMILRKIENMPFRYLSESEIKWLRSKMNDKDEEILEAARNAHQAKFPNYERNMVKKGLTAFSLDFFLHGEVWHEYGDEIPVHVRFTLDRSGLARCMDYTLPEQKHERKIQLESKYTKKLLKYVVHELNAPFWNEDLSDSKCGSDPYLDILPEYRYSEGYIPDCEDWEDDSEEDSEEVAAPDEEQELGEPICTLSLELNNGDNPEIKFYNQLHDEPQELYWQLLELFEPEPEFDMDE